MVLDPHRDYDIDNGELNQKKLSSDLLKGIATGHIQGETIMFHLEQLRDSL